MTTTTLTTIVERPNVLFALANLVQEQANIVAKVQATYKAGLYEDHEAYECDLDDANDGHIIACVAYHAALQLIKGKRINEDKTCTLKAALHITGVL